MITTIRAMNELAAADESWQIPDNLRNRARALMGRLEANGSDVCKLMAFHLWLMITTDTPDDGALLEDVETMDKYLVGQV